MKEIKNKQKLWFVSGGNQPWTDLKSCLLTRCKAAAGEIFEPEILPLNSNNSISVTISACIYGWRTFRKRDYVLVSSRPAFLPFMIALICLRRGASYSLLVVDEKTKNSFAESRKNISYIFSTISGLLDRWLYKQARQIFVLNSENKEIFEKKTTGLDIPVVLIPASKAYNKTKLADNENSTSLFI